MRVIVERSWAIFRKLFSKRSSQIWNISKTLRVYSFEMDCSSAPLLYMCICTALLALPLLLSRVYNPRLQEYATVIMHACVARCLHYVTCLHHALKACLQTLNFSHEPIRFCSIRSSTYTISEFWRVNSSSVRKFISNWRESAVFDFPQCADCSWMM